jgi:hypothetical protein
MKNTPKSPQTRAESHHVEKTQSRHLLILHPFLFALYPVLALFAINIQELDPADIYRALGVVLILAFLAFGFLRLVFRDWQKSGVLTSLLLLLVFSYGHIYTSVKPLSIAGVQIGRHRYLVPILGILVIIIIWLISARIQRFNNLTRFLNITAIASLIIPLYTIASFMFYAAQRNESKITPASPEASTNLTVPTMSMPDIYYIIVDAYARNDILLEQFDYDNTSFMDFLRDRDFYVAEQSNTNYMTTALSLASALNMDYVSNLDIDLTEGYYPYNIEHYLQRSTTRRKLDNLGYSSISVMTGYRPTELKDADFYLTPEMTNLDVFETAGGFNAFEGMLFQNSAGRIFTDLDILLNTETTRLLADQLNRPHQVQRLIILSAFENLEQIPKIPRQKFVFVHILSPHSPYLFGPNGEITDNLEAYTLLENQTELNTREHYRDQLHYITTRLEEAIDAILSRSDSRPVIVLQSDHGPGIGMDWENPSNASLRARSGILNAYLIDKRCQSQLSQDIMPVNTFRIIFNCYFGESYQKLNEISYFNNVRGSDPFNFTPIDKMLD